MCACVWALQQYTILARLQLSFFSIVGIPLFKSMTDIFEDTRPMLQGVMENYRAWEKEAASAGTPATSPRPGT